jgi:hypothetical protein
MIKRGDSACQQRRQLVSTLAALLSPLLAQSGFSGKGRFYPQLQASFNREMRLAVALHTGNQRNYQRLLTDQRWSKPQLAALLADMTAEEWLVVQSIRDEFAALRPHIAARQQQRYGRLPEWLAWRPAVVKAKSGGGAEQELSLPGGYYPPCYADGAQTAGIADCYFRHGGVSAAGGRLLFSLLGVYDGFERLLKLVYSQPGEDVAPDLRFYTALEQAAAALQVASTATALAFRCLQSLCKSMGAAAALKPVQPKYLAAAIRIYLADPADAVQRAASQSALLQQRLAALPANKVDPDFSDSCSAKAAQLLNVVLWLAVAIQAGAAGKDGETGETGERRSLDAVQRHQGLEATTSPIPLRLIAATQTGQAGVAAADKALQALPAAKPNNNIEPPLAAYRHFIPETALHAALQHVAAPVLGCWLRQALHIDDHADWGQINAKLLAAGLEDMAGLMLLTENYLAAARVI